MSQDIFSSIDPSVSGTELAGLLNAFKDAVVSGMSGTSRPTEIQPGGMWVDTTNDPTTWTFKIWNGTADVSIFDVDLATGLSSVGLAVDSFLVKKISADTVGAILSLIKQRESGGGQVQAGDIVGEIRMVGRDNSAGNPVVAKIVYEASENMTTTGFGGELAFYSTPDATNTLLKHMRFIEGLVETILPHKINSQVLVSQNVATAASIAQLNGNKMVVEMTGSTATDVHGINSAHDSKVVTIHNRSTATVTAKHLSGTAAAADQMSFADEKDFLIPPNGSATFYYDSTNSLWKLLSSSSKFDGFQVDTIYTRVTSFTAQALQARITTFSRSRGYDNEKVGFLDVYGNAYGWGLNNNSNLGVAADVVPRSSPLLVLGGLQFRRMYGSTQGAGLASFGLNILGAAYGWGINANGQLGVGNVTLQSSPVAVTGGLRFTALFPANNSTYGLNASGAAYGWGINTNGQLGTGNVTPTSAPTAVLGGLQFCKLVATSGNSSNTAVIGLTRDGVAYGWGINTNGNLGVGDVVVRSSPVAVLGGLTWQDIYGGALSSRYFNVGIAANGDAYAWGMNTSGQLGDGSLTPRSSPVAVLGGLKWQRLVVHEKSESVFGLSTDGSWYAWGDNTNGGLGVGNATNQSSPVAIVGGIEFTTIKPFKLSTFGLTKDGTLYAWGLNANGQLGLGDVAARSSPIQVLGGLKFVDVFFADSTNDDYTVFGVTSEGRVYGWGENANGTIGDGTVVPKSSPVAVLGGLALDATEQQTYLDVDLEIGTSYNVRLGPGLCTFGNKVLGYDISRIEIEYLK